MTLLKIILNMARLANVTASSSQTFSLDHVPQFIGLGFGATGTLDSITITTDVDGVIMNLNDAAFKGLGQSFYLTANTLTSDVIHIPLADGEISNRRCTITVKTLAGASGVDVYDTSLVSSATNQVYKSQMQNILTNGSAVLNKFSKLCLLSMGANDLLTYKSQIGSTSISLTAAELNSICAMNFNNSADVVVLDNTKQTIQSIMYSPTSERTVVIFSMSVDGDSTMSGMIEKAKNNVKQSSLPAPMKTLVVDSLAKKAAVISKTK